MLVCHRRFGKTVFAINEMIDKGLRNEKRNPQYAYIAPTYAQAKMVAWELVKDYTKNIPNREVNEAELRVDIHRPHLGDKIRFRLLSAEKPSSIRGIYLDGCILDEYADCDPIVWSQVVMPTLTDRRGWVIFIGTPKGNNHFYDIYQSGSKDENWFVKIYRSSETNIIAQEELDTAKLTMAEEEFDQEFECSFSAALVGAYYGKEMEFCDSKDRITSVPHSPGLPVYTSWDLGIDDSTAIWFWQQVGREYHFIDYYEASGEALAHYAQVMKADDRSRYVYGDIYFPHDGAARELQTGKSRQQTMRELTGINPIIVPNHRVEDGIHAARLLLAKCWFDEVNCSRGINSLKNYERKWNNKEKRFESKPRHNWASHGSDSFRIAAMGDRPIERRNVSLPRECDSEYDILGV